MSSYRWLEDDNFDGDNDDGEQGDSDHGNKHAHVVQENLRGWESRGGGVGTQKNEEEGRRTCVKASNTPMSFRNKFGTAELKTTSKTRLKERAIQGKWEWQWFRLRTLRKCLGAVLGQEKSDETKKKSRKNIMWRKFLIWKHVCAGHKSKSFETTLELGSWGKRENCGFEEKKRRDMRVRRVCGHK